MKRLSFNDRINKATRGALDFLFPRRCPFCGAVTGRDLLCADCRRHLPFTAEHALFEGTFGQCAAPLYYEGKVRDAILAYKFKARLGGLDAFGQLMASCAAEHYMGRFDAVTWVPVSRQRLKERGYDQSRYLCASLCVDWHTQPLETLRKVVDNPAQSGITDEAQRRANVLGVYEAMEETVRGHRWLLVDDVCTTGATLTECVRVLRDAGAVDVVCLTLARRRKGAGMKKDQNGQT